jgi:hypothetical protein
MVGLKIIQEQVGHRYASTTALYSNPQVLHQAGAKAQAAWPSQWSDVMMKDYDLAA